MGPLARTPMSLKGSEGVETTFDVLRRSFEGMEGQERRRPGRRSC